MITLPKRVISSVKRRLGLPPPYVRMDIFGFSCLVREGGVRTRPDYDDAWVLACSLRSKIIFDVGSNVGQDALLALLNSNVEQIFLIEANSAALSQAAETLIQNGLSQKARFIPAFVGDVENVPVRLWTVGTGSAGSIYPSHAKTASKKGAFMEVFSVTLDSLCEQYDVIPDFIKIDVEGAESNVLLGFVNGAKGKKTRIHVEMHSNPDLSMAHNAAKILDWAESVGYQVWYLAQGSILSQPVQIESRGRCHLLLQPSEWPYPDWLRGIPQSAPLETVQL